MRFVALLLIAAPLSAQVALDETCVVSTLNRTARVLADGSWVLPNVPSNFGSIRVRANCVDGGAVRAGQSGLVRLAPGGTLHVSDIVFDAPRPIPARLTLRAPRALLTAAGETVQLVAIATMPDGALADVTPASSGTDYRTSNPAIAAVSGDGLVTAIASGTALLSATHEGTLGAVELTVVAAADSDGDGLPDDFEIENGLDPSNGADAQRDPDGDGLSIGDEFRRGLDPFDADTDGDGLDDGREVLVVGTDGLRFDTDGDGLSDGLELELGTDPRDGASFDYAAALVSVEVRPAAFAIVFDAVLGEASAQLAVVGALRDGTSIDLTAPSRGTSYLSSDLTVCALGVEPGRVFAGQPGDCTIAVSNSGRTATARGIVQTFAPRLLASVSIPGSANAIDVAGDHAFVAAGSAGLQIVDLSDRRTPAIAGSIATSGTANDVAVAGSVALIAAGAAGLEAIDVTTPDAPRRLATISLDGVARGVAVSDARAVVVADASTGGGALFVVELSGGAAPGVLGSAMTAGLPRAVAIDVAGAVAVVAEGALGVEVFDLSDPAHPVARGRAGTGDANALALVEGYALVADAASSFTVVDVRDPAQPRVTATLPRELGGVPIDVAAIDGLAFTADIGFFAEEAVPIFDVADPARPLARVRLSLPTPDPGRGVDADPTYVYLLACDGCNGAGAGHSHLDIGQYRSLRDQFAVAPQVALTSPHDGDVVAAGSRLEITADASDDVGVLAVEFLVDGAVAGRDERPAFGTTITVPDDATRLTLGARAYDFAAASAFAEEIEVAVARAGTTTLVGTVVGPRLDAVAGARVVVSAGGPSAAATTTSGEDGAFRVADLMVGLEPIVVQASAAIDGVKHRGSSPPVAPTVGGETSVGPIQLEPIGVLYPGPRTLTGSSAQGLVRGSFDRDGIEDVAVIHADPAQGVAILVGQGDGRFTLRQRVAVGGFSIAAGDLTVDGVDDLVVGSGSRAIVLRGAGDGTFTTTQDLALGTAAESPRIGDFDSDGLADVLFSARQNKNLALVLGNGDGSLRTPTLFAVQGSPEDLAIGDFDLDGRLDVAVALTMNTAPHAVAILLGDGAGGLTASAPLSFSLPPLRLGAGDFDDDGQLDLAIGAGRDSAASAFIALGNGDATFVVPPALAVTLLGTAITMAIDDLDDDGRLDLAIGRDRQPCDDILLLRGDGTGSFPFADRRAFSDSCSALPRLVVSEQTGDDLLEVLALDGTGLTSYLAADGFAFGHRFEIATLPEQIVTPDLDRDGVLDLVYSLESSTSLAIQLGNGNGTFRAPSLVATGVYVFQLGVGDLDGDGNADLVVASLDDVATLRGRGNGTFVTPAALLPVARALSSLAVADLTADGTDDVIGTNEQTDELLVFGSRGDGTLELESASPVGDRPMGAAIADFDGDGVRDAAVINFGSDDVSILLGAGAGRFMSEVRYPVRDQPHSIAAADLDLDGAIDLMVADNDGPPPADSAGVTVMMGDGEGGFGPGIRLSSPGFPTRLASADLDVDGLPDLLLLHQATNDLSTLLGVGDGTFLPGERTRAGLGPWWLQVADIDGDGELDLVTANVGSERPGISVILHR